MTTLSFPDTLELTCGPVAAVDLALFAAAAGDHNPLHLDVDIAQRAGFERPVIHGMLNMAFVARMLTQTFGVCSVRSLQTRFVGVALRGDTVRLQGHLQSVAEGLAIYRLVATVDDGREIITGTAKVTMGLQAP